LPWSAEPAPAQLAGGAALLAGLERVGAPALRWYRIAPAALLLGSSQRPDEIDHAACTAAGLTIHRRGSGGGAVLADSTMLLLDLALPRGHPLYRDDVAESYRWIGEVWAAALRELGIGARALPVAEARADAESLDPLLKRVCFGGLSPYEALVGRRKVVGLAQIRRRGGALFQAGVHLRWEPQRIAALMAATSTERAGLAQQLAARVAGLEELCGGKASDAATLIAAFETALARLSGLVPSEAGWTVEERAARAASIARYAAIEY